MSEDSQEIQETFVKESVGAEMDAGGRALLSAGHIPSRAFLQPWDRGLCPPICTSLIYAHTRSKAFPLSAAHSVLFRSPLSLFRASILFPQGADPASPSLSAYPLLKVAARLPLQGPPWAPPATSVSEPLAPLYSVWHSVSIFVNRSRYALERGVAYAHQSIEPLILPQNV